VNIQQTGYYRVQYDEANWMLIARELSRGNLTSIPPNNRAMLIDDAAAFVGKRMLRVRILLELIKYLQYDVSVFFCCYCCFSYNIREREKDVKERRRKSFIVPMGVVGEINFPFLLLAQIDFIPWKAATNKQCLKYMWHMLYDDDSNSQLSQDFAVND